MNNTSNNRLIQGSATIGTHAEELVDYSAYAEPTATDKLAELSNLATKLAEAETVVVTKERELAAAQEVVRELSEKTIPEMMDALEMKEFTTRGGLSISIKEAIRASIPEARKSEAIIWLDTNGYGSLVKRKFVVAFGKDEERWADKFARDLAQRKRQLKVDQDKSVHPKTLASFVKEQLENGAYVPEALFGVFRQRYAKIEVKR